MVFKIRMKLKFSVKFNLFILLIATRLFKTQVWFSCIKEFYLPTHHSSAVSVCFYIYGRRYNAKRSVSVLDQAIHNFNAIIYGSEPKSLLSYPVGMRILTSNTAILVTIIRFILQLTSITGPFRQPPLINNVIIGSEKYNFVIVVIPEICVNGSLFSYL